jgi:hypothetical protein
MTRSQRAAQFGAALIGCCALTCIVCISVLSGGGCAQILGADEHRDLAAVSIVTDGGGIQTFDAIAEVPEAGDPDACAPNQKRCDGTCVSKSSPDYGCSNEGCAPCSVPNAAEVKCTDGENKCAFKTCTPGWLACGAAAEGCTNENTSPTTCGSCGNSCGGPFPLCAAPSGCTATCPGTTTNCSSSCVDTSVSPTNCGGCGKKCPAALNGDPTCLKSQCFVTCRPGFAHCDGNPVGNCVAMQTFYRDADGDGLGDTGQKQLACPNAALGPTWTMRAGDCHDGNKDVFPTQVRFFSVPYTTLAGTQSFDYDCSGVETEGAAVAHFPGCDANCKGSGLAPSSSGRTGPGVNDYCGSTKIYTCSGTALAQKTSSGVAGGQACTTEISAVAPNACH